MASKKIKIEGSKEKGVQGEGKPELLRVEVGGLRAKSFQLSVGALEQALQPQPLNPQTNHVQAPLSQSGR